MENLTPTDYQLVQSKIYAIRNTQVMLDRDLAQLYGVQTKALNQAVKRNILRFPERYCFQLTQQEFENLKSQIVTSSGHGGRRTACGYDIPKEVVSEEIVNPIVHRDYTSLASVEVVLYSDRLEVWNPGQLPKGINLQDLAQPHSSHPVNPLLAEPMFLAKYIEKAGTGTTDIIEKCQQAGLLAPKFEVKAGCFFLTVHKAQDKAQESVQVLNQTEQGILKALQSGIKTSMQLLEALGYKSKTGNFKRAISHLLDIEYIEMTQPDNPTARNQAYKLNVENAKHLLDAKKQ
ncbi:ORF6N domain-containing protein [Thiomicrospira sp. ALE5]|uniref:ORF6N domain-containing protein n=1 Tax=Thiomicrospira sp. ALE5 TaxID=748650 RepID=UPI0008E7081E|nr:ORF6N domain-containing protein [Thiomicrospira sp. ALE5]SFR59451.1 Putative ATP-dependent DNA helicase recG C-terminal [Thiomicrospira sp. ALE5]